MPAAIEGAGVFYLGRPHDLDHDTTADAPLLYDSSDLRTHAVIVGMTGSGKTGLGVGLIEEAALDGIPVLAIDPKGDLANLLLTFPELAPADFAPWVSADDAEREGQSVDERAASMAALWREGLAEWGQGPERIARLRSTVDLALFTPGSDAATPVSVLAGFAPPAPDADADTRRERVSAVVGGLLSLAGSDADPMQSPEGVFLASVLELLWGQGRTPDLADLIGTLQAPPMATIGALEVDVFFPERARQALAMRLNSLLASPAFRIWMRGAPLDADALLYAKDGRPRVSILSIAHLGDEERMFFVTQLLSEVIAWMRRQPGTTSLRALLYMDELFGFLPPTASPPSKALFLTLLKQARAYGLGLVLATQNPVDLDYKALSNCGTWFVGRLQTQQDKDRLLEGLEGAASSLDRQHVDALLSRLPKRTFLLKNINEPELEVFRTRWVLSYLAGPLTPAQLRTLAPPSPEPGEDTAAAPTRMAVPAAAGSSAAADTTGGRSAHDAPPPLPADLPVRTLAADGAAASYVPRLYAEVNVPYRSARYDVDAEVLRVVVVPAAASGISWDGARTLAAVPDSAEPVPGLPFASVPGPLASAAAVARERKRLLRWVQQEAPLRLFRSKDLGLVSAPGEDERAFRIRCQQRAHEARDAEKDALREKYGARLSRLQEQLARAEAAVEREASEASQHKVSAIVEVGSSLLGAFLGRRRLSQTTVRRVGQAAQRATRARKSSSDVSRAEARVDTLRARFADLETELMHALDDLDLAVSADAPLDRVDIRAQQNAMQVRELGVAWVPLGADGSLAIAA